MKKKKKGDDVGENRTTIRGRGGGVGLGEMPGMRLVTTEWPARFGIPGYGHSDRRRKMRQRGGIYIQADDDGE